MVLSTHIYIRHVWYHTCVLFLLLSRQVPNVTCLLVAPLFFYTTRTRMSAVQAVSQHSRFLKHPVRFWISYTRYNLRVTTLACWIFSSQYVALMSLWVSPIDLYHQFCWFMAGRVLVRFWTAAQEAKSEEQIITLRAEVEYIACAGRCCFSSLSFHWPNLFSSAIGKFGERIPLASEYSSEIW